MSLTRKNETADIGFMIMPHIRAARESLAIFGTVEWSVNHMSESEWKVS